ncbi:MAG: ribbon-helix-helix protein, CopG family [Candidatus Aenigmatarchaeota archaeon]
MEYEEYGKGESKRDVAIVVRLTKGEKERLKSRAKEEEVPVSSIVRKALKEYLNVVRNRY